MITLTFACQDPVTAPDLMDLVRAYSPHVKEEAGAPIFEVFPQDREDGFAVSVFYDGRSWADEQADESTDPIVRRRHYKRFVKRTVYFILKELTDVRLPYGSLTGIRPTKLYYDLLAEGYDPRERLEHYFDVTPRKVQLIADIISAQEGIYRVDTDRYDQFANIPVCPTRCAYCSFIAETYRSVKSQIPLYASNVAEEIEDFFKLQVPRRAIYVGGGTPTSIPLAELDKILSAFHAQGEEFTVEAGRPETVTKEALDLMVSRGVTRVSVNPQTFKQATLAKIGRAHTVDDILRAYQLVRETPLDVNMDLIAMLPDESMDDFAASVERAIDLGADNITVHSLSIKRGSVLNLQGYDNAMDNGLAGAMSDYAYDRLTRAGYVPYYMYRQKNTEGRLENVGYTKPSHACIYNVDIMEETHSVHASGAGAISKRVFEREGRIERLAEIKEVRGFNERIEELRAKKQAFFA
ncbi:MAG: coproporphyrinogen dehydrogenase HemZ [Clostridia bacterium]|nr:coproporphyrinogen dehydrogenase HemZ [Clostridia bacterium]